MIHPTAVIDDSAVIGENNEIGPYCVIGPRVVIGDNNTLVAHVCIGTPAQHRGDVLDGGVKIGNGNTFHEFSQVHRSTNLDLPTTVGNNCYLMKGAHVSHDCILEDDVTLCNDATLGGHTYIMRNTTLGFLTVVHQKQVVGSYVQTGMGTIFPKYMSIEPGSVYAGNPAKRLKDNVIGLERAGVTDLRSENERFQELRAGWSGYGKPNNDRETARAVLAEYAKHRDGRFDAVKWDIAETVKRWLPELDWPQFKSLYDHTFSFLWQQQEDFENTQYEIRDRLVRPAMHCFEPDPLPGGKNVAWLIRHATVGMYAPYKHVRAFIDGQVADGVNPFVYIYGKYDAEELRAFTEQGVTFRLSNDPAEIRAWCEFDEIGTLITESYSALALALFTMRCAPVQFYLSPGFQLFEPADAVLLPPTQMHLAETTIPVASPMLWDHLCSVVPAQPKPGKVVFGVLGRYEKMDPEYLAMVEEILERVPEAVFCAWGRGEFNPTHPRMKAMGFADPHSVLPIIDVYLDTYKRTGGISVWEAMAHRVPVVTRSYASVDSWNLFKPHLVHSKEAYINKALELLENPDTERGHKIARNFSDYLTAGQHLNEVIQEWQSQPTRSLRQQSAAGQSGQT